MIVFRGILSLCFLNSLISLTSAQYGAKCSDRLAEIHPRQLLDINRMTGEWYGLIVANGDRKATGQFPFSCTSNVLKKQAKNSFSLLMKKNLTLNGGLYVERNGHAYFVGSEPSIWRLGNFDNPLSDEFWEGAIIATDYDNYWIQYECQEINGYRKETGLVKYRARQFAPGQQSIYESLLEGLGFPKSHFVYISQTNC